MSLIDTSKYFLSFHFIIFLGKQSLYCLFLSLLLTSLHTRSADNNSSTFLHPGKTLWTLSFRDSFTQLFHSSSHSIPSLWEYLKAIQICQTNACQTKTLCVPTASTFASHSYAYSPLYMYFPQKSIILIPPISKHKYFMINIHFHTYKWYTFTSLDLFNKSLYTNHYIHTHVLINITNL